MGTMCIVKNRWYIVCLVTFLCGVFICIGLGCRETTIEPGSVSFVKDTDINESNFKELSGELGSGYVVKFANVWDDFEPDKMIRIPIYGGIKGDVKLSQLRKKRKGNASILGALVIETGQGKVKQGILDCLKFYQKSLLKGVDITKPTLAAAEMSGLIIWYDFDYAGMPCAIMIGVAVDPNCEKGKFKCRYTDINDIEVEERAIGFGLRIMLNHKTRWRKRLEEKGKWPR